MILLAEHKSVKILVQYRSIPGMVEPRKPFSVGFVEV